MKAVVGLIVGVVVVALLVFFSSQNESDSVSADANTEVVATESGGDGRGDPEELPPEAAVELFDVQWYQDMAEARRTITLKSELSEFSEDLTQPFGSYINKDVARTIESGDEVDLIFDGLTATVLKRKDGKVVLRGMAITSEKYAITQQVGLGASKVQIEDKLGAPENISEDGNIYEFESNVDPTNLEIDVLKVVFENDIVVKVMFLAYHRRN